MADHSSSTGGFTKRNANQNVDSLNITTTKYKKPYIPDQTPVLSSPASSSFSTSPSEKTGLLPVHTKSKVDEKVEDDDNNKGDFFSRETPNTINRKSTYILLAVLFFLTVGFLTYLGKDGREKSWYTLFGDKYDGIPYLGGPSIDIKDTILTPVQRASMHNDSIHMVELFPSEEEYSTICSEQWFDARAGQNIKYELKLLRRFNYCFASQASNLYLNKYPNISRKYHALQETYYPWLVKKRISDIPKDSRYVMNKEEYKNKYNMDEIIDLRMIMNNSRGRGMVTTASQTNFKSIIGLISHLKYIKSELPMEIFINKDVSYLHVQLLKRVSKDYLGKLSLIHIDTFIKNTWIDRINNDNSKYFALILSQFEEILYLNPDTVPLIRPEEFFELDGYKKTGMYLFKERFLNFQLPDISKEKLKYLLPDKEDATYSVLTKSASDMINSMRKYHLTSSLFVVRKNTHFTGLLMALNAQFWKEPIKDVMMNNEALWLGQALVGNENYYIHNLHTVVAGEIIFGKLSDVTHTRICSTHPMQISEDEKNILFISNGFDKCMPKKEIMSIEKLAEEFIGILKVENDESKWGMSPECNNGLWCVTVKNDDKTELKFKQLESNDRKKYKDMSINWIKGTRLEL